MSLTWNYEVGLLYASVTPGIWTCLYASSGSEKGYRKKEVKVKKLKGKGRKQERWFLICSSCLVHWLSNLKEGSAFLAYFLYLFLEPNPTQQIWIILWRCCHIFWILARSRGGAYTSTFYLLHIIYGHWRALLCKSRSKWMAYSFWL